MFAFQWIIWPLLLCLLWGNNLIITTMLQLIPAGVQQCFCDLYPQFSTLRTILLVLLGFGLSLSCQSPRTV